MHTNFNQFIKRKLVLARLKQASRLATHDQSITSSTRYVDEAQTL
jgi:hypothetical protein